MEELIADFSKHLTEALQIGNNKNFTPSKNKIDNVLICGLGGSGIGGTIISLLLKQDIKVPVVVNKDYAIPSFVNENTLVICSSYSGNTEETLAMYEQALSKNAEIAVISSGGKIIENATSKNQNFLQIPGGLPPRAAFGYSFPQLFFILNKYELINDSFIKELNAAINLIDEHENSIKSEGEALGKFLWEKLPVIYSESSLEGVAVRFRQQLNENSKVLCWHSAIPEMNHNELVGWKDENMELAVVILSSDQDYYRNKERFAYTKEVIRSKTEQIKTIEAKGASRIEQTIYLIHLTDWASYFLGKNRGMDIVEVDVITGLKNRLAEIK